MEVFEPKQNKNNPEGQYSMSMMVRWTQNVFLRYSLTIFKAIDVQNVIDT